MCVMSKRRAQAPNLELLRICAPLLDKCDALIRDFHCRVKRLGASAGANIELTRMQTFITRYLPGDKLLQHVDGVQVACACARACACLCVVDGGACVRCMASR